MVSMRRASKALSVSVIVLTLGSLAWGAQLTTFSRSFDVGAGGDLVVDLAGGDIQITTATGVRSVQVDVVGIDQKDLPYLETSQSGPTVRVSFKPRGRGWSTARFEFTVPEDFDLNLRTSGGDISIQGSVRGTVSGTTAGGDIRLQDVEGEVNVTTSGGDISAGQVRGDARLTTAGGDVVLELADGEVEIRTSGGDIRVGDIGRRLTAATAGGDIRLGNVGGTASVKTAGGDISVGNVAGTAELATAGGDIELMAAGGSVQARTSGGNLTLREVEGPVDARTAGGNIVAEIIRTSEDPSNLRTSGGDVELRLAPGVRATISALIRISGNWERESRRSSISCDLAPFTPAVDAAAKEIRAEIPINGGGTLISLETVNGNIRIKGR
jgi:DUF4097 and DUF4098 domain-containing protein YvlB